MDRTMKKLLVVDVDNTILDWEFAFDVYANTHGFYKDPTVKPSFNLAPMYRLKDEHVFQLVKQFNESAAIGFLPALRDAWYWVRKLGDEGWRFHGVTSVSDDPNVKELRIRNLEKQFGKVFEHVECLSIGASKRDYLEANFKDSGLFWVEDNVENAELGLAVGMKPLLVAHNYNRDYTGLIPRVMNWEEIYALTKSSVTQ
jgi:FMN phosphatase YigB (HAD superfamily)